MNENKYHPIRDYLNTLVWDGTERIRFCLRHFLGADADDYTYEALKLFLLGAISRAFQPGCKFEIMLCLVGGQGAGKSTFFRLLAVRDEWFSDDLRKLDDDNVYRKLQGHWIRKVYLPRTIAGILKEWHTRQLELIDLLGADYQNYNLVLAQNSGKPYDSHQIYKLLKTFIHAHHLPDVTFHSLRHSSVTYKLALNDGNIKLVQGDTGHTSSKLMLNTYAEIFDQSRKELAVRFEENFYAALQP